MRTSFRETLWFKYGHLDSEVAAEMDGDEDVPPLTPDLPIEDRYADDGTVTRRDSAQFGIHTGCTSALPPIRVDTEGDDNDNDDVDMQLVARDLHRIPRFASLLIVIGLIALSAGATLAFV